MSAAVTRELSIIYGSLTMGGTSDYVIPGKYTERVEARQATVSWTVGVANPDEALFVAACQALEAEMAKRFLRFRVLLGSATPIDWNPSNDSGFLAEASCEKVGGDADTGRSREYRCSVTVQLPATDNTGRRWAQIDILTGPNGLRTVTIFGQYTAQAGVAALANYQAKIGTFATSCLTLAGGGTYNLTEEDAKPDDQNKLCDFRRVYRQIGYSESAAGTDHSAVKNHSVTFALDNPSGDDTVLGQVKRLQRVTASYVCDVDYTVTTDLKALWADTLRQYVLDQAQAQFPGEHLFVGESPSWDRANYRITCTVVLDVITTSRVHEYSVSQSFRLLPNKITVPIWNGKVFGRRVYQGPATLERTTVVRRVASEAASLDTVQGSSLAAGSQSRNGSQSRFPFGPDDGWIVRAWEPTTRPYTKGLPEFGRTAQMVEQGLRVVEEWVEKEQSQDYTNPPDAPSSGTAPPRSGGDLTAPTQAIATTLGGTPAPSGYRVT